MNSTLTRASLILAALFGCNEAAPQVTAPQQEVSPTAAPEAPTPAAPATTQTTTRTPPTPRMRPASPLARASAARDLDEAARNKARLRAERLRAGRRLGRDGDHAGSLAAFAQGLEAAPGDSTLLCEAGFQAFQLGRLDQAAELLEPSVARVMPGPTRGACLYNLGRVREAQGQTNAARTLYTQSLDARPNRIVQQRLRALPASAIVEEVVSESPPLLRTLQANGAMPTLEALAALGDCFVGNSLGVPPEPTASVRELFLISCDDEELERTSSGVLVVRGDNGFSALWPITSSDDGDMYGRVEPYEVVREPLVWSAAGLTIHVDGAHDEVDGEGEAYFACENEHEADQAAMDACFAEAMQDLGEPYTWTHEYVFRWENGTLRFERSAFEPVTTD